MVVAAAMLSASLVLAAGLIAALTLGERFPSEEAVQDLAPTA